MMRIAFLIEWSAYSSSGVLSKVEAQVRAWRDMGHQSQVFVVTPRSDKQLAIDPHITTPIFFPFPFQSRQFLNKVTVGRAVRRSLRDFCPDLIYYRQSMWYPGQVGNLRCVAPYVVELNSFSDREFRMKGPLISSYYCLTEPWLLNGAAGFVSVSGEIAQHYARYGKRSVTVANGFPVARCQPRPSLQNERPQLIFVGTPNQSWHGLDKIVRMAAIFPGWDFHIAGPTADEIPGILPNIKAHGYLQQSQLSNLYRNMDVGIGTLALHRNGMEEASPLKVREYVANGLPVIAGYLDSDLSGCDFFLNIGNTEDNVSDRRDAIREFVAKMSGRSIDREEVLARVDAAGKEATRLAFMKSLVESMGRE